MRRADELVKAALYLKDLYNALGRINESLEKLKNVKSSDLNSRK